MDEITFASSSDFLTWRQAVIDQIQNSRATRIDVNIDYPDIFNSEDRDIKPIFDALAGSDVTEFNLGRTDLTDKIQDLTEILSRTKIEELNIHYFCRWAVNDFLRLMAVLKETRITELGIPPNSSRLWKHHSAKKLIAHIVNSRLSVLDVYWFYILPDEKLLVQRLPDTKVTSVDLSGAAWVNGYKKLSEWVYLLISMLPRTLITDLCFEKIEFGDDIAKALGSVLEKSKLEKLSLQSTMLTDSGVDILANGLINSKLTYLNLKSNKFKGDNNFGRCLKNTKIRELDLSENSITKKKMFSAYNFLEGSAVTSLKLSCCFTKNGTFPLHLKKLKFSELTCLDLGENRLDFEHISALANVLSNSSIIQLNLGSKPMSYSHFVRNNLSSESFEILGECLTTSKLQYINLCNTSGIEGLASFLEKTKGSTVISINLSEKYSLCGLNETLKNLTILALDFERNCLENSITSFAEQLKFTAIVELSLNKNNLGDGGALILAHFLEETQIVRLSLCDNSISNQGAEALALVLKKTKIRQLNLKNNKIENDGVESLAENARNSCITYLNIERNPAAGTSKLLVDGVICENRRRIKIFAELVNRISFFTGGDSDIFEFDRNFSGINIDDFIEGCLKVYCFVQENPFIVDTIEQDKCTSGLRNLKRFDGDTNFYDDGEFFVEDSPIIYQKTVEQSVGRQTIKLDKNASLFSKKMAWLILEEFPRKFVTFVGKAIEPDVEQHVSLLKKIGMLGLSSIEALLLLNRPMYVIDENQDILHPYVYMLLHKYKQPICNLEIEPKGGEKIIEYFTKHSDLDGAVDVVALLKHSRH